MENRTPVLSKKKIEIDPLSTVSQILGRVDFLPYSTQLRNLAYQIQLFEFLRALHRNYKIDRGLECIYSMQVCHVAASIIEHLLFCGLEVIGKNPVSGSRHRKATALNQAAKKVGLIDKTLSKDLQKFIDIRNDFHPERQTGLHIKKANSELMEDSRKVINRLGDAIRKYLEKEKKKEQVPF